MNLAKTSFSREIFAGAIIGVVQCLAPLQNRILEPINLVAIFSAATVSRILTAATSQMPAWLGTKLCDKQCSKKSRVLHWEPLKASVTAFSV
jgi:hypothetical protein